ncbi:MAG TPA: hypothetical protein HA271_05210 [Methanobacterium subterraneum]|uniref:Uncharacterized protein n=1 Tax=Methanobacterium subterraneum TaxID=59277 RepID=A0A7J4TIP6_9EURY|nr:hypothetical protein [Methanobacterium subterraneum]
MKLETPKLRILTGIILGVILVGLCIHYATEYHEHLKYPSYETILTDYPEGEVVNVDGSVISVYNEVILIEKNHQGQMVTMKVENNTPVEVKDHVSVVGVLGANNTIINVERVEVNEYWKYLFLLLRSLLVLIFLGYLFHRYWSFDWEAFHFRRR